MVFGCAHSSPPSKTASPPDVAHAEQSAVISGEVPPSTNSEQSAVSLTSKSTTSNVLTPDATSEARPASAQKDATGSKKTQMPDTAKKAKKPNKAKKTNKAKKPNKAKKKSGKKDKKRKE